MGCGAGRPNAVNSKVMKKEEFKYCKKVQRPIGVTPDQPNEIEHFTVQIVNHLEDKTEEFSYKSEFNEILLTALMNILAFDADVGTKLDANFISIFNPSKNDFDYFVERLLGISLQNEDNPPKGKIWVPYINAKREDWSFLCENNRIVNKNDSIVWRLEMLGYDSESQTRYGDGSPNETPQPETVKQD
jgi:hypothetical protein